MGACIARMLARQGCDVMIHYASNQHGAQDVVEEARALGRRAELMQADLTDREQIEKLCAWARSWANGRLDVLVNNAANFERVEPQHLSAGHWDRAMDLNVTAPYLLTTALADLLRASGGCMVAIACVSAFKPWRAHIPYSVSKAALVQLVRGLALGLAPRARANAVAPGAALLPSSSNDDDAARLCRRIPLQRIGEAEDVARAVLFLVQNDYITGDVLTVDGGLSLR